MGMSIKSSSAGMAQSMSSVSSMQQQMLMQALKTTAQAAPAAPVEQASKPKPVGNIGHNINVTA